MANIEDILKEIVDLARENNGSLELGLAGGTDAALVTSKKLYVSSRYEVTVNTIAADRLGVISNAIRFSQSKLPVIGEESLEMKTARLAAVAAVYAFGWIERANRDVMIVDEGVPAAVPVVIPLDDIRRAGTLILATKINYYSTNHHTVGNVVGGFAAKVLATKYNIPVPEIPSWTALCHTVGHWASTRIVFEGLNLIAVGAVQRFGVHTIAQVETSNDVALRLNSLPAGMARLGFCYVAARRLASLELARYVPWAAELTRIAEAYNVVIADPIPFHLGAHYLTAENRRDNFDDLQVAYLGRLVTFVRIVMKGSTLAKAAVAAKDPQDYDDFAEDFLVLCTQYVLARAMNVQDIVDVIAPKVNVENPLDMGEVRRAFDIRVAPRGNARRRANDAAAPVVDLNAPGARVERDEEEE